MSVRAIGPKLFSPANIKKAGEKLQDGEGEGTVLRQLGHHLIQLATKPFSRLSLVYGEPSSNPGIFLSATRVGKPQFPIDEDIWVLADKLRRAIEGLEIESGVEIPEELVEEGLRYRIFVHDEDGTSLEKAAYYPDHSDPCLMSMDIPNRRPEWMKRYIFALAMDAELYAEDEAYHNDNRRRATVEHLEQSFYGARPTGYADSLAGRDYREIGEIEADAAEQEQEPPPTGHHAEPPVPGGERQGPVTPEPRPEAAEPEAGEHG